MAISNLDAEGEAWEMRFETVDLGRGGAPQRSASRLERIASVVRDAFKFIDYDGILDPFVDS
jgi:hypothetical protein